MSAEHVNTTSTKNRNAGGAPVGNQNHLTHGVFKLEAERKRGQIDRRTSPYRLMKKLERSVESNFTESRKKWHRKSIARGQHYVELVDEHVLTLKYVIRKGRVTRLLSCSCGCRFRSTMPLRLSAICMRKTSRSIWRGATHWREQAMKFIRLTSARLRRDNGR